MSLIPPVRITEAAGAKTATISTQGTREALDVAPRAAGFGILSVAPSLVPVGATSALLLAANPARAYAHVINNSAARVFVQYGEAAAVGRGIQLAPGGVLTLEDGSLWLGAIYCISGSGTVNIEVMEAQ